LQAKYGSLNTDKVNFVNDLKSFVLSHSTRSLKSKLDHGLGKLNFKLNDQQVELTINEDFFLSAQSVATDS
jgi:hypothetical protein